MQQDLCAARLPPPRPSFPSFYCASHASNRYVDLDVDRCIRQHLFSVALANLQIRLKSHRLVCLIYASWCSRDNLSRVNGNLELDTPSSSHRLSHRNVFA
uniref:Uncharacterized protein n=1 Tax=Peronospora matthiolae TaxID=2874970 RepID=A0AAV1UG99_9STRA